ncbi:MAG: preprotein translocase subunit SecE [Limimaricola sp.]|uniref:preprotein translocase subunit SecE n=1 Tax=Limimaricola sp. TaxID=2211665 RepID=UPI001DFBA885|nr:preprotein translocase subunit SecE [Limimaricola sp.]MBI1415889.1 preprotein translocase subunit SecE [Limimaricola sp.]
MARPSPMQFIQQTRSEIGKVAWPSRREVLLTTAMVVALTALISTYFSVTDLLIRQGLHLVLGMFGS